MTDYSKTVEISAPTDKVYEAITEGVANWWTTGTGDASRHDTVFTTRFGETHNHIKIAHLVPDREVDWHVLEQYHASEELRHHDEWTGTKIIWRLVPMEAEKTRLDFTHEGLIESMECWNICEAGWNFFLLESLKPYLETGQGQPFQHK